MGEVKTQLRDVGSLFIVVNRLVLGNISMHKTNAAFLQLTKFHKSGLFDSYRREDAYGGWLKGVSEWGWKCHVDLFLEGYL